MRRILDETNTVFLRGGGTVHLHAGDDRDGGAFAHWELSWPEQRDTAASTGRVEPIQVNAAFGRGNTHPHLRGAVAGMWPCQVINKADAERQEPILRAIVESELHQRIFQGTWRDPSFRRRSHPMTPPRPVHGSLVRQPPRRHSPHNPEGRSHTA